ncbi:hypothetical protein [Delftia acidovorans]|uniref:hypothetical protein n=1 Tax=Delftia acidovorans TaxID=80866 RepID=UPI0022AB90FA|nr:hypothetical protein [Delftia acidovorans]WAT88477.1 hypothetical protein O1V13_14890 [Delftia acidovorans]
MLYFQMSEDEFNQLNRVREQWGLISSLLIGAYPSNPMEVVESNELLAFINAQIEAMEAVVGTIRQRGVMKQLTEEKILAKAVSEIRLLLSGYLGSNVDADPSVRIAAHLAYALHNDALAVLAGNGFSADEALKRVAAVDSLLGVEVGSEFVRSLEA